MAVPICLIGFAARNTNDKETIKATKEAPATFVFDTPVKTTSAPVTTIVTTVPGSITTSADMSETTSSATTADATEQTEVSASETNATVTETTSDTTRTSTTTTVTTATTATTTAAEPVYHYKNGTFEGAGEGYAGKVHVSITIEDDNITAFSAYADEDDPDYFSDAMQHVIPQIQQSMSSDVDACSGATYSSNGIMEAARNALEKAEK
jgi:uncharacterized protein with FMN-binding domain